MEKKYFNTKKGSVEERINKIASEQPTINTTYKPDVKLTTEKKYFETKPGSIGDIAAKVVSENNGLVGVGGGRTTKGGPQMYAVTDTYHFGGKGKDDVDMSYKITAHVRANNINSAESAGEALVKRSSEYKEILAKVQKKGYDTTPSIDGGNVTKSSSSSEKVNVNRVSGTTVSNTPLSKREGMDPVNKDAVKKKFADRKDKDIDNDGDVDSSDKFLHKRRKAISKAMNENPAVAMGVAGATAAGTAIGNKVGDKITSSKKMKEDLGKEDEPKVKKIIGKLKKASDAHAGQAKDLQKAMTEDDMAKFHKMQKDGKSAEQIAKALDIDVKSTKKLMDSVMPDDKGEFINKQKHAAAKRGEKKPIDPEPKIGQIIKGEKETTRANGHMTKKKFSEMRMKLGQKGKTETGKEAPVIDTEPKAEKI